MNLRLSPEAEEAVRREAERTGRSQHEVIREAIGRHLGLVTGESARCELGLLVSTGNRPPTAGAVSQGRQAFETSAGSDQRRSS